MPVRVRVQSVRTGGAGDVCGVADGGVECTSEDRGCRERGIPRLAEASSEDDEAYAC